MKISLSWPRIFRKKGYSGDATAEPKPEIAASPARTAHRPGSGAEMEGILEEVESSIISSPAIPWTPIAVIDQRKILTAIDRLRTSLPREVEAGKRIVAEEERMRTTARLEAARIVGEAEKKAEEILEESHLKKRAEEQAKVILREAQTQAGQILQEAEEQAWRVYQSLEESRELLHSDLLRMRTGVAGAKGYRRGQ
ncbi:MAG: hypothetical protein HYX86_03165 [Chloroflexi bacterium]|nr:hypothetical protein [Chloroflexota bacterium]